MDAQGFYWQHHLHFLFFIRHFIKSTAQKSADTWPWGDPLCHWWDINTHSETATWSSTTSCHHLYQHCPSGQHINIPCGHDTNTCTFRKEILHFPYGDSFGYWQSNQQISPMDMEQTSALSIRRLSDTDAAINKYPLWTWTNTCTFRKETFWYWQSDQQIFPINMDQHLHFPYADSFWCCDTDKAIDS